MTFEQMKRIDPRDVDITSLTDIGSIEIDKSLSPDQRLASFLAQVKNPYLFRCGKMVVKISYADTDVTLEDRLEQFIRQKRLSDQNSI